MERLHKKLQLNKEVIAKLNDAEQLQLNGGTGIASFLTCGLSHQLSCVPALCPLQSIDTPCPPVQA